MNQEVTIGSIVLKNPIIAASGTFGYGLEFSKFFDVSKLGAFCTKGLSLEPRDGNNAPRIRETSSGMLNSIGVANIGVEAFCKDRLPILRAFEVTTVINVFATSIKDFILLTSRLDKESGITALEINISCPNVDKGGSEFGLYPETASQVTQAVKNVTSLPIWVKLTPQAANLPDVAKACEESGADAICAINTIRGMSINVETRRFHLGNRTGGLSGPAIKPIALRMVWEIVQKVSIPVIGIGGICSANDVLEFLLAGASAVQVGSANIQNPMASYNIVLELEQYCKHRQISIRDLIGKVEK
jgi:dihydroorotate dehydrogenase (NAD+) catalytic subunit